MTQSAVDIDFWKAPVASYLPPREALHFAAASKKTGNVVGLRLLKPLTLPGLPLARGGYEDGDRPKFFQMIEPILPHRSHTVILKWKWKDQGWGNQKGHLYLIRHQLDKEQEQQNSQLETFGGGTVICESPVAEHHWQSLSFSYRHDESNCEYSLWYSVGGGGGHTLEIKELKVQTLIFGDAQGIFARQHDKLLQMNLYLPSEEAFLSLLKANCKSLQKYHNGDDMGNKTNDGAVLSDLVDWFGSCGFFDKNDSQHKIMESLDALEVMLNEAERMQQCNQSSQSLSFHSDSHSDSHSDYFGYYDDDDVGRDY